MMTILAKALSWFVGSGAVAPLSLLAALTFAHQAWQAREARVEARGEQRCEAEHQLAMMRAQRDRAQRVADQAVKAIEIEKQLTESMRYERHAIAQEFEAHKASASADPRCLSDGVLDLLRGREPLGKDGR